MYNKLFIYTDGGSRGNPGPSAVGVYITDERDKEMHKTGKKIGIATNNIAEYMAILEAYSWITQNKELIHKETQITFFMDSQLAYSQLKGLYKIKNPKLREIISLIREKESQLLATVSYQHIRREKNTKADKMVNMALDNKI